MKLHNITILSVIALITTSLSVFAQKRSGNYLDSRIGDVKNQTWDALVYHADKEWLYDFDTKSPFEGISSSSGTIVSDKKFFMSAPQSMKWNTSKGASLLFNANVSLAKVWPNHYYLTLGMFQEDVPTKGDKRVFKLELLDASGAVIISRNLNMHRGGWNILCSDLKLSSTAAVDKVRITQIAGVSGAVLLDNFMISAFQNNNIIFMANGSSEIEKPELTMDSATNYPVNKLTEEEKQAFFTIAEKVIPLPKKVKEIVATKVQEFKDFHAFYEIVPHGEYASGKNPLYYWRSVTSDETGPFIHFVQNEKLCGKIKEIGMAWYQTQDARQKKELGILFTDLIRLAVTFGDMPNPWYNGRGFAEGVYYAKDLLEEAGLLDRVTTLIMQQYGVDLVLFNDQKWDNPLGLKGPLGPEFFWQATADHLNTTSKSMILSVLVGANAPEKARNLKRFKSWLDNIALTYSPGVDGTLKPDGSWFHHWGNRYDNYGWVAGWFGSTELIWWLSHTPFSVSTATYERMNHMAEVHFDVMDKNGYVSSQDKMHRIPSDGFFNLARSGTSNSATDSNKVAASYWLAYPQESSYSNNPNWVKKFKEEGIAPAPKKDKTIVLSYEPSVFHRNGDWQLFARGISKEHYHTQYKRNGFLFYNIGGLSLQKEGQATGMQNKYGVSLLQRHDADLKNITPGYNFSRALGVTSVASDFSSLEQLVYQKGTSGFVGGVSNTDGMGIFVQEFDATKSDKYANTVASGLGFKKSYFFFDNDVVLLANDISNNGKNANLETGLLQEPTTDGKNEFILSNKLKTSDANYNLSYSSTAVPWMFNSSLNMGLYLMPNQNFKLFKGEQTFGTLTGDIISTYLSHEGESKAGYEIILKLNSSEKEMQQLALGMKAKEPEYEILQRNTKAHIVFNRKLNTTGYAFFEKTDLSVLKGILRSVDKACLVLVAEHSDNLNLSVSNPDKGITKTAANPLGWSLETEITIVLKGEYVLSNTKQEHVSVSSKDKTTIIIAKVKEGLPINIPLIKKL